MRSGDIAQALDLASNLIGPNDPGVFEGGPAFLYVPVTDLHALGVVLYELATGQHPYRDDDLRLMIHRILDESPRRAGDVNPQLSPFFEEVVHTLLAKDPNDRFQSAKEIIEAVTVKTR